MKNKSIQVKAAVPAVPCAFDPNIELLARRRKNDGRIKSTLRPFIQNLMYTEVPMEDPFPIRDGWKQYYIGPAMRPPHSETQHTWTFGMPGVGKSVSLFQHLDQIRAYREPCIVYDPTGEFTECFYREGRDVIMSPFDVRAASWNLFGELSWSYDIIKLAAALVEEPTTGEKFWSNNARILFADIVRRMDAAGMRTNRELFSVANEIDLKDLHGFLKGTHGGALVDPKSEKTAIGIRSELGSTMLAWPYLKDEPNSFSLSQFIRECEDPASPKYDRWLFLTDRGDVHALMKPLISLWLEIVCSSIISLPPRADRRIHVLIDELPGLQKLPSLQSLMAQGRKYGTSISLAAQLFSQMVKTYGREDAESLVGVAGTLVAMRAGEPTSAEFLTKTFGNLEEKEKKESRTMSANDDRDSINFQTEKKVKDAVIAGELLSLKQGEAVLKTPFMPLVKIKILPVNRPKIAEPYVIREDLRWSNVRQAAAKVDQITFNLSLTSPEDFSPDFLESWEASAEEDKAKRDAERQNDLDGLRAAVDPAHPHADTLPRSDDVFEEGANKVKAETSGSISEADLP